MPDTTAPTYFTRGPGPLVSVLLPTRGRPVALLRSYRSLLTKAADPLNIEVLIRCDNDDDPTCKAVDRILGAAIPGTTVISGPRGRGYDDLHLMVNELAASAKGDWLLLWNDDAEMMTTHWDRFLGSIDPRQDPGFAGSPDVCLVQTGDEDGKPTTVFPLVRRAAVQRLGHYSLNAYNDAWVGYIYQKAGASIDRQMIRVLHNHRCGQAVSEAEAPGRASHEALISPEGMALKEQDAAALRAMAMEHRA